MEFVTRPPVPGASPGAALAPPLALPLLQVSEAPAQVVSGRLPSWLRGSLLLNGCGDFRGMQHLFDGYACLSRVRLDGQANSAWASQRFLDTDAYRWGAGGTHWKGGRAGETERG